MFDVRKTVEQLKNEFDQAERRSTVARKRLAQAYTDLASGNKPKAEIRKIQVEARAEFRQATEDAEKAWDDLDHLIEMEAAKTE